MAVSWQSLPWESNPKMQTLCSATNGLARPRHKKLCLMRPTLIQSFQQLFFFFFLRKISPELTSAANPPLFLLRKTGPELTSVPIFLHFICGMATAWLDKQCHVRAWDPNRRTLGCSNRTCVLNCCATG